MANLYIKGSRPIPLASKEAKKLLSQSGLSLIHHTSTSASEQSQRLSPAPESTSTSDNNIILNQSPRLESRPQQREGGELYCQSCRVALGDREEQVIHYRLDWHRYNLKRRLKGQASLSQEEFEKIAGGDLSSISGSESDSDSSKDEDATSSLPGSNTDFNDEDSSVPSYSTLPVGSPFLYFSSQDGRHYAVYRSLITNLKPAAVMGSSMSSDFLLGSLVSLTQPQVWIILMRAGGHFAGAVFRGSTMVAHKTFHRYTVRAKRGTAQSIRDGHQGGHAPKSAGASLRRYNESALVGEIRELISSWSSHVEGATAIFIRTPKYGKGVFIGDGGTTSGGGNGAPFLRTDPRLRNIPFATRRPTVKEVQNAFSKLAAIYEVSSDQLSQGLTRSPKAKPKKPAINVKGEKEATVDLHIEDRFIRIEEVGAQFDELELEQGAASSGDEMEGGNGEAGGAVEKTAKRKRRRRAKKTAESQAGIPPSVQRLLKLCKSEGKDDCATAMTQLLREMGISITNPTTEDTLIVPSSVDMTAAAVSQKEEDEETPANLLNEVWNGETVLHVAAASGNTSLIPILLLHGADPAIKNGAGQVAYVVAKDKAVRDAFRRFMAQHPSSYDYSAAKLPSPLTEEMERERKEKLTEKKKALKKAKKQREKEHKAEKEMEQLKLKREKAVAGLSEREKRALAAEKRMSAQLPNSSAILKAGVCSFCESSLAGLVPFERLQFKYCSMDCLKNHRKQMP